MQVIFTGFWNHSQKRLVIWNTQWTDFNCLNVSKLYIEMIKRYDRTCSGNVHHLSVPFFILEFLLNISKIWHFQCRCGHYDNLIGCSWLTIYTLIFRGVLFNYFMLVLSDDVCVLEKYDKSFRLAEIGMSSNIRVCTTAREPTMLQFSVLLRKWAAACFISCRSEN